MARRISAKTAADAVFSSVAGYVERQLEPLRERIAQLEQAEAARHNKSLPSDDPHLAAFLDAGEAALRRQGYSGDALARALENYRVLYRSAER